MQKILVESHVGEKWSEKKMKEEDDLKTVECLRGRLLAEREASRNAKQENDKLENKLIELENLLKEEIKSRNRAQKKLEFLTKKLKSLNISSVSKNLGQMVSDNGLSSPKDDNPVEETLDFVSDACFAEFMSPKSHSVKSIETENSSIASNNVEQNALQTSTTTSSQGEESNSSGEASCERSINRLEFSGYYDNSNTYDHSLETPKGEDVDNSMALVPVVTKIETKRTMDPDILDATVKEVLESLHLIKQKLQISMEQGRTVKVG